jgi:hypothetical protein
MFNKARYVRCKSKQKRHDQVKKKKEEIRFDSNIFIEFNIKIALE